MQYIFNQAWIPRMTHNINKNTKTKKQENQVSNQVKKKKKNFTGRVVTDVKKKSTIIRYVFPLNSQKGQKSRNISAKVHKQQQHKITNVKKKSTYFGKVNLNFTLQFTYSTVHKPSQKNLQHFNLNTVRFEHQKMFFCYNM